MRVSSPPPPQRSTAWPEMGGGGKGKGAYYKQLYGGRRAAPTQRMAALPVRRVGWGGAGRFLRRAVALGHQPGTVNLVWQLFFIFFLFFSLFSCGCFTNRDPSPSLTPQLLFPPLEWPPHQPRCHALRLPQPKPRPRTARPKVMTERRTPAPTSATGVVAYPSAPRRPSLAQGNK